ncbi:penicillin acylase family protein [Geoglobus acetivorans]
MRLRPLRRGEFFSLLSVAILLILISPMYDYMNLFAPFGQFWKFHEVDKIELTTPYGKAVIEYDEYGVPHITADNLESLFYATGYAQAKDRLFQMDLQRRLMKGQLSEVFGESLNETDEFYIKMDFEGAAKATWEYFKNSEYAPLLQAYCDGVNKYIEDGELQPEFKLLGYTPKPWTPVDTFLVNKLIAWGLTGDFWDLKRAVILKNLPEAGELYPDYLNHTYQIINSEIPNINKSLVDWLSNFEKDDSAGSNNWLVSGKYTENGKPMLSNDPHLSLRVPPVWYMMHLKAGDFEVQGVTFPGIPVIIIGQNKYISWGVTNVGADVIDFYTYKFNGDKYLYKGEWREVSKEVKTLKMLTDEGIKEKKIVVEKTVHGPLIEKYGTRVAVAWTGLSATTELRAIFNLDKARNVQEAIDALKWFYVPAQNFVIIDREGNTAYYPAGKYPIRYTDGKEVPGNVIFNGSRGEGEWVGFTPYGISSWEGFIPFKEIPHLINPDYVATANQRPVLSFKHYIGDSGYFADPYRGMRIYEMLKEKTKDGRKLTVQDFIDMQKDVYSKPAEFFVNDIRENFDRIPFSDRAKEYAKELINWDYRMTYDSKAALIFSLFIDEFMNETFHDEFSSAGLDESYYPKLWVLQNLPENSKWFDDINTEKTENRYDIIARAMDRVAEKIEEKGWTKYGDINRFIAVHPFYPKVSFMNYQVMEMNGSKYTVYNFRYDYRPDQAGSSWRMITTFDDAKGIMYGIIPGGNSGNYFSKHYQDLLEMWKECRYIEMEVGE